MIKNRGATPAAESGMVLSTPTISVSLEQTEAGNMLTYREKLDADSTAVFTIIRTEGEVASPGFRVDLVDGKGKMVNFVLGVGLFTRQNLQEPLIEPAVKEKKRPGPKGPRKKKT